MTPSGQPAMSKTYSSASVSALARRASSSDCGWAASNGGLGCSLGQVCGENLKAPLVVADLRGPKIPDLLRVLARMQHAPAIDAQLAVGKRNRGQFHAHAIKLGDKSFDVEVRHFRFPLKHCQTFCAARSYALNFYAARRAASWS